MEILRFLHFQFCPKQRLFKDKDITIPITLFSGYILNLVKQFWYLKLVNKLLHLFLLGKKKMI